MKIELETRLTSTASVWMKRLQFAREWRKNLWNGSALMARAYKIARGDHWSSVAQRDKADHTAETPYVRVTVNQTGAIIEDFLPFLTRYDPKYMMKPKRPGEAVKNARNMECLLNYFIGELGINTDMRRAVRDMLTCGHGVVETGFVFRLADDVKPDSLGLVDYDDAVREEYPFVRRVNPLHFLWDPLAPDCTLSTARWCAKMVFRTVQDIVADKRYKRAVRNSIRDNVVSPTLVTSPDTDDKSSDEAVLATFRAPESTGFASAQQRVLLWEIWDRKFKRYMVLADGVEDFLVDETWPYPYMDEFPFVVVRFIDYANEHYSLGIPALVMDQQYELDRIRTQGFAQRRRTRSMYQVPKDALDSEEMYKLETGGEGTIVQFEGASGIEEPIRPITNAGVNRENRYIEDAIMEDMRALAGTDELMRGGKLPSRTSATEVRTRTELIGQKIEGRVQNVDNFYVRVGRFLVMHIQANLSKSKMIRIVGLEAADEYNFLHATPENISGEFDVEVHTVAASREDPVVMRQQRLQVFQILASNAQLLQASSVPVNWGELFRWLLESFGEKEVSRFFPLAGTPIPLAPAPGAGQPGPVSLQVPGGMDSSQRELQRGAVNPSSEIIGALSGALSGGQNAR